MNDLTITVNDLEAKVKKLVTMHKGTSKQLSETLAEKNDLLKTIEAQKNMINDLEEKNKVIKIAKSLVGKNDNTSDVKLKINELVREIDKCIALLNR